VLKDTELYRSAIEDTSFSPEVKAKCMHWHQRGADLLATMDRLLQRRQGTTAHFERAEEYLASARAILAALRSALDEVLEGSDALGQRVVHARARLQPNAALEAVKDLKEGEIAALRALKLSPPANVRNVVCCACSLLRLTIARSSTDTMDPPLATWEEAQAMLASPSFRSALRGFDPHILHQQPSVAQKVRSQLATLPLANATRRGASTNPAIMPVVAQAAMLQAAVRSGGRSVGQLFLWCSRVLAEAEALREAEALEQAQLNESDGLTEALERAQKQLEECEARLSYPSSPRE